MKKMLRKFAAAAFVIGFAVSGAFAQSQQTNPEKLARKEEAPAPAKQEVNSTRSNRAGTTANPSAVVTTKTNAAAVVIPSKVTPNANIKMMDPSKPANVPAQPVRVSNVHKAVPANYNPADHGIIDAGSKTDN
jgi:hypothetical protein